MIPETIDGKSRRNMVQTGPPMLWPMRMAFLTFSASRTARMDRAKSSRLNGRAGGELAPWPGRSIRMLG